MLSIVVLVLQVGAEQDDALLLVDITLFWGSHEALECVVYGILELGLHFPRLHFPRLHSPEVQVVVRVGHKLLGEDS